MIRTSLFLACDPWSAVRAKNPAGIELSVRLLREGELIRAEVHYPSPSAPPAAEIWPPSGFLLDPATVGGALASSRNRTAASRS